jgi:Xaa-Pro aminopeptidase
LRKQTKYVRYSSVGEQLHKILYVKLPGEVTTMRRAASIGDKAFSLLLEDIQPGVTELHLAKRLEQYCSDLGSERPSFDTIVLFGDRSAHPHGRPGNTTLRKGAFVLVDFGCTVDGFASDMTRTVVCGKASEKQRDIYNVIYEAQAYARKNTRAGMTARAIDALARQYISNAGFTEEFGHALGHGVGRRIHEAPRISMHGLFPVPANTVFTIEPGIYIQGFGGIRIEDLVVMKEHRVDLLTHSKRELIEI